MHCLLSVVLHSKPLVNTSPHCDILLCRASPSKERQPAQFFLSEWHPYTHFFPNYDEKETAEMFSPLLSVVVGNLCGTQEALSVLLVKLAKSSLSKGGESYYCVHFTDIKAMYRKSIVCMCGCLQRPKDGTGFSGPYVVTDDCELPNMGNGN